MIPPICSAVLSSRKFILISLAFVGFSTTGYAQVTTTQITDSIYLLSGKGGNIGVVKGENHTYMIDDKFADTSKEVSAAIHKLGGSHPEYLFNTHFHGDHTGGNEHFGAGGSTIVAHHNVHKRMAEGSTIAAFNMVTPPASDDALPEITYQSDAAFHINGERVLIYHVPNAHTDGDSIIHFEGSNVIHTGDIFFNGFYPFIDVSNGGSIHGVIDAVNGILDLSDDNTQIIPGHGPMASKQDLIAYRDMLVTAVSILKPLKEQGKTAKEAAADDPLFDLEENWAVGIFNSEKWIEIIYDSI